MRFKKFSIIISFALVVVCLCSFVAPSVQASFLPGAGGGLLPGGGGLGGLLPYISTDLADWIIDNGFDIANYIKSLFDDDVCELSGNGKHDFVQRNLTGSDSGIYYVCQYCGELGSQVFQEAYGTPATGDTEGTGFLKQVEDELGTTVIGDNCILVPLYIASWSVPGSSSYTFSSSCRPGYSFYIEGVSTSTYYPLLNPDLSKLFNGDGKAPFTGSYYVVFDGVVDGLVVPKFARSKYFAAGSSFTSVITTGRGTPPLIFLDDRESGPFVIYGTFYLVIEIYSYSVNNFTSNIGGIDSRATSFTGDIGIMGDNGQLTKVEGNQIFNETTNNYYNPSTGTTSTATDWTYDYSDRSYHLTMESGDTVTVTYGDENITIQEGDTTYNVYYIVENKVDPGDVGEDGHVHQWGEPTESTPASCTDAGYETFTCSVCGETKTTTSSALGHKWKVKQSVQTKYDENGELLQQGYTIYECERCGEQYKSTDSSGPPGGMTPGTGSGSGTGSDSGSGEDDESIWSKLGKFLGTLGDGLIDFVLALIGKVLDWLISLAEFLGDKLVAVAKVILDIFDFLPGLFTGFLTFLESAFGFLPTEIVMILTFGIAAIVFIGIIKAIRR